MPENIKMGIDLERQRQVNCVDADKLAMMAPNDYVLVDLREDGERHRHGVIKDALHAPYSQLDRHLSGLSVFAQKPVIFYCAAGERSAMAVRIAADNGVENIAHMPGGFAAWKKEGLPVTRLDS